MRSILASSAVRLAAVALLYSSGCGEAVGTGPAPQAPEAPAAFRPQSYETLGCVGDKDCFFGETCVGGVCLATTPPPLIDPDCVVDADCPDGEACAPSLGQCVALADDFATVLEPLDLCDTGETRPCGTKAGRCEYGIQSCSGGHWEQACAGGVGPIAEECNGIDDDCDGAIPIGEIDTDGDGITGCAGDCAPADATVYPGAVEICDAKDNDCDPSTADGSADPGYGDSCDGPDIDLCDEGVLVCPNDGVRRQKTLVCDDGTGDAADVCDGIDNDCDAATADGSGGDCASVTGGDPCLDGVCSGGTCIAVDNNTCDPCAAGEPVSNAGPDRVDVVPDTVVQLDGNGSSDPNGDPLTYLWRVDSRPTGSTAPLSNPTSPTPTILGDVSGDYVICVIVTDVNGCVAASEDCMTLTVAPEVELHIELVWFSDSSDIDLHYLAPPGNFFDFGGPDCHYMSLNPDWGLGGQGVADGNASNDPILDVDNIAGFGPENINQDQLYDTASPHKVGVHYYSDKGVTGAVSARIRIYVDGAIRLDKTHSLDCNELWEVAAIDVSGNGTSVTVTDLGLGTTMTNEGQCTGSSSGGGGGCCSSSTSAGCSDFFVETCVCLFDSYCCTDAWDTVCVGEVQSFGCGSCP